MLYSSCMTILYLDRLFLFSIHVVYGIDIKPRAHIPNSLQKAVD
jgi:hypothetical protein